MQRFKKLDLYEKKVFFLNSPNQPWSHAARQSEGPRAASGGRAVNVMRPVSKIKKINFSCLYEFLYLE